MNHHETNRTLDAREEAKIVQCLTASSSMTRVPRTYKSASDDNSSIIVCLGSLVERCALLDGHEALDAELLAGLLDSLSPSLDVLVGLLASSRRLLAHDLAALALHQVSLLQATRSLLPLAAEHTGLLTHLHGLLHGFSLHRGFHRFHGKGHGLQISEELR